jgi:phosphoglycerate dehydrogenase-like enzyme
MSMKKAALLGPGNYLAAAYPPDLRARLAQLVALAPKEIPPDAWRDRRKELASAEFIFSTWGMPALDDEFLAAASSLKAVFYAAGTVKSFTTPAAAERGIIISAAAEANGLPVAEYCLAVILLSLKNFWAYPAQPPAAKYIKAEGQPRGVYGATIGLVSLGAVGRRLADLLANHEVRIIVHDPYLAPEEAARHNATPCSLDQLFRTSDVVSLHTPWIPETEGMIRAGHIRTMKHGATFINTSRGAVVDEPGLCLALRERPDITAILDVTHPEPPAADSPLRTLPNVILTPHIAGSMGNEVARLGWWMLDEAERLLDGRPLRHRIDYARLPLMA